MSTEHPVKSSRLINTFDEFARCASYSLVDTLTPDPDATPSGEDYAPRQVFSGHYVPVKPTALPNPVYVSHSKVFFEELGLSDEVAQEAAFIDLFSGNMTQLPDPLRSKGWATGYALSIYGTEYTQQCPFRTGNAYGDGRAISVLEVEINGKRWEMQLKGGGRTPYCRGADGRAVLRSSVREFLAQEHMHALGIPTTRSLSLITSFDEYVTRPWYSEGATYADPDIMVQNPVAITTRVAPSFLRVGQIELFGRRARNKTSGPELNELKKIVEHLIDREYRSAISDDLSFEDQVVQLVKQFKDRLVKLVAEWIRVGFCQGNFNSDNCAAGGFTLDYGPFGFCEKFDHRFQPWTGGGSHFSFFNQPAAAEKNFSMFCSALAPLIYHSPETQQDIESVQEGFSAEIDQTLTKMWALKLGLPAFSARLTRELLNLMLETGADYTIFFRQLSDIPDSITHLERSFYNKPSPSLESKWVAWLNDWREAANAEERSQELKESMRKVNPKFIWKEWLVVPAYEAAAKGDFSLVSELQQVLNDPYSEQSEEFEEKFYRLRPESLQRVGGVSHYSCSS